MEQEQVRVDTGLAWPVKESFLRYVRSDPMGATKVVAGAGELAGGQGFYFPPATEPVDGDRYNFAGAVQFRAHGGMMQVVIVDPVVDMAEPVLLVRIDNEGTLRPLVDLDLPEPVQDGAVTMWQDVGTTLRSESVLTFGEVYPAGTAFDPLTIRVATPE